MHPPVLILLVFARFREAAIKLLTHLGSLPKSRSRSWHNHSSLRVWLLSITMASSDSNVLHPPRLAQIFARSPTNPGTPVHSIQTMRRKSAGHGGPLTKILVANRGVWHKMLFSSLCVHCFLLLGNCYPCIQDCSWIGNAYCCDLFLWRSLICPSPKGDNFSFNRSSGCPADYNSSRLMRLTKSAKVSPQLLPISRRTTSLEYPLNMELTWFTLGE